MSKIFSFGTNFKSSTMEEIASLLISLLLPFLIFTLFLSKFLINRYKSSSSSSRTLNLPPSPPKLPIIGNIHQLSPILHQSLESLSQKYGPVMMIHIGSKPVLIISSSDAAEQVLKRNDLNFLDRAQPSYIGRLSYNFKDMIFQPYGEYWRQLRFICVSQLLSNKRVQSFRSIREQEIRKVLENIRKSCLSGGTTGSIICVSEIVTTLTSNILSLVVLGKRYSDDEESNGSHKLSSALNLIAGQINIGDYINFLGWINHINGMERKVNRVAKEVDEYLESIIEQGHKKQDENVGMSRENVNERHQNFLDVLLHLQQEENANLHCDSIKAILLNMMLAGAETTYSLMDWAFSELLRNPNVMAKLQIEVRQFSGRKLGQMISEDDLEQLPYLRAVIKETLRTNPPVTLLNRVSREDVKIMEYDVASGTEVFINVKAIGRDPRLWEEADEFRPERFLSSPIDFKGQHFEYLPFGSGRRICPGSSLALTTAQLTLANLIHNFNFALPNNAKPDELDMSEAHGMVTKRKIPLLLVASLPN